MQRQNFNQEMQKAKEEGQVQRQEDMEKMQVNMRKMHTRYSTSEGSKSILNQPSRHVAS